MMGTHRVIAAICFFALIGSSRSFCIEDEFRRCLDEVGQSISHDDDCGNLPAIRNSLLECGQIGAECLDSPSYQQYVQLDQSFDQKVATCAPLMCIDQAAVTECRKPLGPISDDSKIKEMCQLTLATVDQVYECIDNVLSDCPKETREVYSKTEKQNAIDALKDKQEHEFCDAVLDPTCTGVTTVDENFDECAKEINRPTTYQLLMEYCSDVQKGLDCIAMTLNCEKLMEKNKQRLYHTLESVGQYGCELTWDGEPLVKKTGCNMHEALNCYKTIQQDISQPGQHLIDHKSGYAWVNKDQEEVCSSLGGYTEWTTLTSCVNTHTLECDTAGNHGGALQLVVDIGFLSKRDVTDWSNYCKSECNDIQARESDVNSCLENKDLNEIVRNINCVSLRQLNECAKTNLNTCSVLQREWVNFLKRVPGLTETFSICSIELAVPECMDYEAQKDTINEKCIDIDTDNVHGKLEFCSGLAGYTRCIAKFSFGCKSLGVEYVEPHLGYFAAMNSLYGCEVKYNGGLARVEETGTCSRETYYACHDDLTTALGVPDLRMANITTATVLLNTVLHLQNNDDVCTEVEKVEFEVIKQCLNAWATGCNLSQNKTNMPWSFNIDQIKEDVTAACSKECKDVDTDLYECGNILEKCNAVETRRFLGDPIVEECATVREHWTCLETAFGECEYAEEEAREMWLDACADASTICFGKDVPQPEEPPTTATTSSATDIRPWICVVWISLCGFLLMMIN